MIAENKEIICKKCGSDCKTGAIFLKDGTRICVNCIYEVLGGDNDNGHDWTFSKMQEVAERIANSINNDE